ncbi:DNA-binding protein RFX8-like [Acipenser oxyrinchus oxyrinchus]|uniref:DNA-binding protein RFX8 n=1 Tax=Acipenser oxyrinchus oxyrinchus TaxID=40147 RepID=A0AAD8DJC9_ACIOX|nr:DNA-binding protein RFX8-like [Acipenser oxyrinchus oxyrinchus]
MAQASPNRSNHSAAVKWLVDNFYTCEGYSIPRCLMYDFYLEACSRLEQNQVNAATFGKLVRSVFTDLRTRRLGTRGSARYHYDGISVKKRSPLYARYCFLMKLNSIESLTFLNKEKHGSCIPTKNSEDQAQTHSYQCELVRNHFWEKQLEQKYFHRFTFIADEYHNYCQDILQNVQDVVIFFWKSLPVSVIELMSLPDVSQLFSSYDAQLYKMIEGILINDFLEEVSVQDLKKARMFSKNFRSWLLTVLDDFPIMLQASKRKEAIVFVNRLRRKSCLCNLVKTMKSVINDSQIISTLKSDLHSILTHGILNIPRKSLEKDLWESEEENSNTEIKWFHTVYSWLSTSADIKTYLDGVVTLLQAFIFQVSSRTLQYTLLQCTVSPSVSSLMEPVLNKFLSPLGLFGTGGTTLDGKYSMTALTLLIFAQGSMLIMYPLNLHNIPHTVGIGVLQLFSSFLAILDFYSEQETVRKLKSRHKTPPRQRSNGVFSGLAADFLLRWNYFLTDISRAMILSNAESFGSWHLLNLLLSDYVLHVLHSYMEEKTEWLSEEPLKELLPLAAPLESELSVVDPPQQGAVEQSYQSAEPANSNALTLEGITVHVVGFLVDSATGNKLIQIMLEDKSANCAVKVDLPVGQEAMVTLRDGQKFMIHTCDIGAGEDRTEEIPTSDFIYAANST